MFPAARQELDQSRAQELGRQIIEMKQKLRPDRGQASGRTMMKALVYQGPGKKQLEDRPMPQIEAPTDALVKIVKTTICGTDLHISKAMSRAVARGVSSATKGSPWSRRPGPGSPTSMKAIAF
jgi:hypothetical protein